MITNTIFYIIPKAINIVSISETSNSAERLLFSFVFPIIAGFLTFIISYTITTLNKRRNYSRLGVVIIESLQEEINSGISIMEKVLIAAKDPKMNLRTFEIPPNHSWNGMSTISDEVLLRIIAVSHQRQFSGFHPKECRIHCKNYFTYMIDNYKDRIDYITSKPGTYEFWKKIMITLLDDTGSKYLKSAKDVYQMLENAKILLDKNSKVFFPK